LTQSRGVLALDIFASAVSLASIIFMGLVFYMEGFEHRGLLFIEPNIPLALFEFGVVVMGFIVAFALWVWRLNH
jgi:hypothetical protein